MDEKLHELRQTTIAEILAGLDTTLFTKRGFHCEFNKPDGTLVRIVFKERPSFRIEIRQPGYKKDEFSLSLQEWTTLECPGHSFSSEELYTWETYHECQSRISQWSTRLLDEILVHGSQQDDVLEVLRRNLEENADALPEPETPFQGEEALKWKQKLDEVIEHLSQLSAENESRQAEIGELQLELGKLKEQIDAVPKKTWLRAVGNRILTLAEGGASAAIKSLAEGAVKALIGP